MVPGELTLKLQIKCSNLTQVHEVDRTSIKWHQTISFPTLEEVLLWIWICICWMITISCRSIQLNVYRLLTVYSQRFPHTGRTQIDMRIRCQTNVDDTMTINRISIGRITLFILFQLYYQYISHFLVINKFSNIIAAENSKIYFLVFGQWLNFAL